MARRNAKAAGGSGSSSYIKLANWAATGTTGRVASGWSVGQRFTLTEAKTSTGAQCYHVASGTETLRFRLREFVGGVVLATKDVAVSATGIVAIDWDTPVALSPNIAYTITVFNTSANSYTNFTAHASLVLGWLAQTVMGGGFVRLHNSYGVGDTVPTNNITGQYPVDCILRE
jgi:hypothetical protein